MTISSNLMRNLIGKLTRNNSGAAAVEFAILAPIFFTMMLGILQVGVYLQNYNAVQSLASDGARHVMVEYQKNNELTDEEIRTVILAQAVNSPYLLDSDRMQVTIDRTGSSRVTGATEIDLRLQYTLNDFLPIDIPITTIDYSRPVWVIPTPAASASVSP